MFFKSALLYRITGEINWQGLAEALQSKPHREPASQEVNTYGFIAPFNAGAESPLIQTYASGKFTAKLIAAKKTERILPSSVVRDELKARVDAIEAAQLRKVYKKERDQIKDDIVQEFLPRAFTRSKVTFALLMDDMIIVDASSFNAAEDLLSTLRECLGSLPVRPMSAKLSPSSTMTSWLKTQETAAGFFVLDECELRDTHEDGGTVRCKRQDMTSTETQEHLNAGKQVTKLSMAWQDKLSFVLDDKLTIKRLRFEDLLHDQAEQDGGDDQAGQLQASLAIFAGSMFEFVPALLEALGGEEKPASIADTDGQQQDDLYDRAVAFVRDSGCAGVSDTMRKFSLNYNRAASIIERMESEGIVTPMQLNGSREVIG